MVTSNSWAEGGPHSLIDSCGHDNQRARKFTGPLRPSTAWAPYSTGVITVLPVNHRMGLSLESSILKIRSVNDRHSLWGKLLLSIGAFILLTFWSYHLHLREKSWSFSFTKLHDFLVGSAHVRSQATVHACCMQRMQYAWGPRIFDTRFKERA